MKKKTIIYFGLFAATISSCKTAQTGVSKETRTYLKQCADSINNITRTPNAPLPYFLTDPCLDYEKKYWSNLHKPLLIRKEIIDRVKNPEAITYILNSNDRRVFEKCSRQPDFGNGLVYYHIDLLDKSFADLLETRLIEISHKK
ncbi:hypothetical protein [Chitinophaga sp. Cy-1792]|uniref:hypothetical protein n=1 Tax=Chitinophaga sp. Cy-1792 TaxID=2608339 RepID=UPI00142116AB|nr:hypothetical protein [Chitinophaga sp. Cy-1792]NIG53601.1 hypothetical protein [Chitinophaga sp. Cy-1792]